MPDKEIWGIRDVMTYLGITYRAAAQLVLDLGVVKSRHPKTRKYYRPHRFSGAEFIEKYARTMEPEKRKLPWRAA